MEKIDVDTDQDFFMSAPEAVEYGLLDAIVSSPQPVSPMVPPEVRPAPNVLELPMDMFGGIPL